MTDGTGTTSYTYDDLSRPITIANAQFTLHNSFDAVGNRTGLTYPDSRAVTYSYDDGNRLESVTDWRNGQFGYNYDEANRLAGLTLPNGVRSDYGYDAAGRLTLLAHDTITASLAGYDYALDNVGNRRVLTETIAAVQKVPAGAYLETGGQVVIEAETGQPISDTTHAWITMTRQSGYSGDSYLHALPDTDALYLSDGPAIEYAVNFTTPGTYTVWLRGYATNAAGDSVYVGIGDEQVSVTGLAPRKWEWANTQLPTGEAARLRVQSPGLYTVSLQMREDGLRIDRLLLTTDTTYVPVDTGLAETTRQTESTGLLTVVDRTINYDYDQIYRLTGANYTTGQSYAYDYDPVGNRLQQIIDGDTTTYLYDAANRLASVNGETYTFDANGNLLNTGVMTNTWDAANRLTHSQNSPNSPNTPNSLTPIYNGLGDRVGQTVGVTTTYFALDVQGLPEVIYTSEGNSYLHLPGVIMTESAEGEVRYLLGDGLGSVRQGVDDTGSVVAYNEFDPYGKPIVNRQSEIVNPYGFTGEWWQSEVELLHLRARWYAPETGTFLSRDTWAGDMMRPDSLQGYSYAANNPILHTDPSGFDYIARLDRYTCDDPRASGGYVWQYDRATRTTGWWPCVVDPNNVPAGYVHAGTSPLPPPNEPTTTIGEPIIPNIQPSLELGFAGYVEGAVTTGTAFGCQLVVLGEEVVYDLRSGERANFTYTGDANNTDFRTLQLQLGNTPLTVGPTGVDSSLFGPSVAYYAGPVWGFTGTKKGSLELEYSGPFWSGGISSVGGKIPVLNIDISLNASIFSGVNSDGSPNFQLWGVTVPIGVSKGISKIGKVPLPNLPANISVGWTNYTLVPGSHYPYRKNNHDPRSTESESIDYQSMQRDMVNGVGSPIDITEFDVNMRESVGIAFQNALDIGQQIGQADRDLRDLFINLRDFLRGD